MSVKIDMSKGKARELRINEEIDYIMNAHDNGMNSFTVNTIMFHLQNMNIPFTRKNIVYDLDKMVDEGGLIRTKVKGQKTYTVVENLKYINYLSNWKRIGTADKRKETIQLNRDIKELMEDESGIKPSEDTSIPETIELSSDEPDTYSFSEVMKNIDHDVIIKSLATNRTFIRTKTNRVEVYPIDDFDGWFKSNEIDGKWTYGTPMCIRCNSPTIWMISNGRYRLKCTNDDCGLTMKDYDSMIEALKAWMKC